MYPTCMILQVLLVVQRHAASSTRYDLACPQVPQMPASEMLRDIAGRMEFVSEVFEGPVILLEMTGFPEKQCFPDTEKAPIGLIAAILEHDVLKLGQPFR